MHALIACLLIAQPPGLPEPVPYKMPAKMADEAELLPPGQIRLGGWLGARVDANARNRMKTIDTEPLLAGFQHKPGTHPWIGEHVGKWLHAATLAWANTGDPELKAKLDRVAAELIAAQEPDGYLGTYVPEKRFGQFPEADWDVWSHKYCLIGLLTYYQYTGDERALAACKKAADLLLATFPAKKSILAAGTHMGMASTSVLEPIVILYRLTGDAKYLEFARYIVKSWDEEGGPRIVSTLLKEQSVQETANAKAYEMLSNLVGLCELARATGDEATLKPALIAWEDVVSNRLYLTGSASAGELFRGDHELPNDVGAHIGETCVTTTWIQLNLQLLRLTGEARFGDELERSFTNHLAAAQHPDGADWCYYTALEGAKQYDAGITCCHSSGPRGLALAPQAAFLVHRGGAGGSDADALLVNTFEPARVKFEAGGQPVEVIVESGYPREGRAILTVRTSGKPARFALRVRVPAWAAPVVLEGVTPGAEARSGWATIDARDWSDGDQVTIRYPLDGRVIEGTHGNAGKVALAWGPFVLAYDSASNPGLPSPASAAYAPTEPPLTLNAGASLSFASRVAGRRDPEPRQATFVPFADAGAAGGTYRVWLRAPGANAPQNLSLLIDGQESRSRPGNVPGSIVDGDPGTFVVTFDARPAESDWFAATVDPPAKVARVVFRHGRSFHDGGWFDASKGKPRVEVQAAAGGPWELLGTLDDYPATTATDPKGLRDGKAFTLKLPGAVPAFAVRVVGAPAAGDNPNQAFASCAELEAFAD